MAEWLAMKWTILFSMLLCHTALAQTPLTIKGHALGETFEEFVAKAGDPSALSNCVDYLQHHKLKNFAYHGKDLDNNSNIARCNRMIDASQGNRSEFFVQGFGDAVFNDRKLVGVTVSFYNSLLPETQQIPYEKVREDAIAKYGPVKEEGTETWQNGFGATFHPRYCQWSTSQYHLKISELPKQSVSLRSPDVVLQVSTTQEELKSYQDKVAGPNVLDK